MRQRCGTEPRWNHLRRVKYGTPKRSPIASIAAQVCDAKLMSCILDKLANVSRPKCRML